MSLRSKKYLLQGIDYSMNTFQGRLQHVIEYSIKSEHIVLTPHDIHMMETTPMHLLNEPHDSLTDVFTILCGTGIVKPYWNREMLDEVLITYLKMYMNPRIVDVLPRMETRIGRLLAYPMIDPAKVFANLPRMLEYYSTRAATRCLVFVTTILALPQMRHHLLLDRDTLASYLGSFALPIIAKMRYKEMSKHKKRMRQFKEGIAMRVWHPTRVARWLEVGGWPLVASIAGDDGLA
jgi:hypothetical protein